MKQGFEAISFEGWTDPASGIEAVNRRGRTFECLVRTRPLITADGETYGALVLMSEAGQS